MVDQAQVNRSNGSPTPPASPFAVVSNLADFSNDIATLGELQAKLTALDAREAGSRAAIPLLILVAAAALAIGSIPVILIGLADWIASAAKISSGVAQLAVGLVALMVAVIGAFLGFRGAIRSLDSFRRSREEFVRNLSWIRTVLVYSGREAGKRRV